MLSQRGKPLLVHDGHTFGIQYVRKDKKYWQCNLSRKYNCKARVTTTETGDIIVTNNEHCHTEIRQHLRKDYQRQKVVMNALINLSSNRLAENLRRHHHQANSFSNNLSQLQHTLALPQAGNGIGAISPIAAHSANSIAMQRLLDIGKFSPSDHAALAAAFQKQHDNSEDIMPLDCGIRSHENYPTKDEPLKELNTTQSSGVGGNDSKSADTDAEAANADSALPIQE